MNKALKQLTLVATLLASVTLSQPAAATIYTDATGEAAFGGGILDITSVEVSNDPTDLIFKITFAGDIVATDWGNYMIGIDTITGGDTNGNGWGRPIKMTNGMDYWIGTWVNSGNGGQLWTYSGTWNNTGPAPTVTKSSFTETVRLPFASLGLSTNTGNNTFDFDIYTSGGGGGDSAIDALSTTNQSVANWGDTFITTNVVTYTIQPVDDTPTNRVFFSVDMQVPIHLYTNGLANPPIPPTAFEPGADQLYVVGSFNGFAASAPYQLIQVGTSTVYTNTVDVIANLNSTIEYKFKGEAFPGFEVPQLNCGGNRTLLITNANMVAPTVFWNDSQLTDPTNVITFQVDMLFASAVPPGTNVYVRGDFNDWGNSQPALQLTNIPSTTIWVGTLALPYFPTGGCKPLTYKFVNGTTYESIANNRSVNVTTLNPTLASVFNNVEICDVVEETNFVTFTVSMTNAVGTDATVYDGTQSVYLNGGFAGWWGWGNTNDVATNYLMTPVIGTSNHTITVAFPAGSLLRLVYKYAMNGNDNEGGFQQDHVRYIRTVPGQTSYSLPLDQWTGTNANNIANLQEPKFGLLTATPGGPGQIAVNWLGLKCVGLQSSTTLTNWTALPATDGQSATNIPTSGNLQFFRLSAPNTVP
jgi:hypothetical protein